MVFATLKSEAIDYQTACLAGSSSTGCSSSILYTILILTVRISQERRKVNLVTKLGCVKFSNLNEDAQFGTLKL